MSSTRKRDDADGPMSQNRYMSSREFAELRGISGTAVAARAAVLPHFAKRKLLYFIQAMSLEDGGLPAFARDLVSTFPERLNSPTMRAIGLNKGRVFSGEQTRKVLWEIRSSGWWLQESDAKPTPAEKLVAECRRLALAGDDREHKIQSMEEFLIDLCVNPALLMSIAGEDSIHDECAIDNAKEEHSNLESRDFKAAGLPYFDDILGALIEYKRRSEEKVRREFYLTAIGNQVWQTLDHALKIRGMAVADGLQGRGKTEAVKAWCRLHLSEARYVSLDGITNKTTFFRSVAKACGLASGTMATATQMQDRVTRFLQLSKLMLVLDEGHWMLSDAPRMYKPPELIDWIDTALCNHGVPVGISTTPQFLDRMSRAAKQVGWNFEQFRRRCKRYKVLPEWNTPEDVEGVVRRVFSQATNATVNLIRGYVAQSKRDLSAVGDIADEIRSMTGVEDVSRPSFDQVEQAIKEQLIPSDLAFKERLRGSQEPKRRPRVQSLPEFATPNDPAESRSSAGARGIRPTESKPVRVHQARPAPLLETVS